MKELLDRMVPRRGGGGPGSGDNALYRWETPWGYAEYQTGWGAWRVWIDDIELLLVLCEGPGLRPPRFAESLRPLHAARRTTAALASVGSVPIA